MQTCVLIFMGNFGHITLWIAKHCQNKGFSEEWLFNVQNNRTSNELVRWIHKGDNIDCVKKLQQDYIDLDLNMWIVKSWNQIKQAGKIQAKLVEDINSNSGINGVPNYAEKTNDIQCQRMWWNTSACDYIFNYVGGFPSYNPSPPSREKKKVMYLSLQGGQRFSQNWALFWTLTARGCPFTSNMTRLFDFNAKEQETYSHNIPNPYLFFGQDPQSNFWPFPFH